MEEVTVASGAETMEKIGAGAGLTRARLGKPLRYHCATPARKANIAELNTGVTTGGVTVPEMCLKLLRLVMQPVGENP